MGGIFLRPGAGLVRLLEVCSALVWNGVVVFLTNTLWLAGRVFVSVRWDREGLLMCVCLVLFARFGVWKIGFR